MAARREHPTVFWFNPLAEGRIACGNAFTPIKHQAALARDLATLPQFLSRPGDIVLVERRPSAESQGQLKAAGFIPPAFIELAAPPDHPAASVKYPRLGALRPWAWAPDSLELFLPLFGQLAAPHPDPQQCFNPAIARLYSKAWSADLLRKLLDTHPPKPWLCEMTEIGLPADDLDDALRIIAAIRARGHQRIIAKESVGVAGQNALRLWEPELLENQRRWLTNVLERGRQLVIEPWLERAADFSLQYQMEADGLRLLGCTRLLNDARGQYLGNSTAPDCAEFLPAAILELFPNPDKSREQIHELLANLQLLLERELREAGYLGPAGIDAFVYRTPAGECRVKPVVELNPRYTMGRVAIELMQHAAPERHGLFRLVSLAEARAEGARDFSGYARLLQEQFPLRTKGESSPRILEGALCLTDPEQAQACVAVWEVSAQPAKGSIV
jgi:hypothetical protein